MMVAVADDLRGWDAGAMGDGFEPLVIQYSSVAVEQFIDTPRRHSTIQIMPVPTKSMFIYADRSRPHI